MDRIKKLLNYSNLRTMEKDFPSTVFNYNGESGLARMQSCIGFLMGVYINDKSMAERLATSLFNAFYTGCNPVYRTMNFNYGNGQQGTEEIHKHKLVVHDDGTFLGFGILNYYLKADQNNAEERDVILSGTSSEYGRKYRYIYNSNGGILFHGFADVYAITLDKGIGWQMHT